MATDDQNQIRLKLDKGAIPALGFGTYAPREVNYNVIERKKSKLIWADDDFSAKIMKIMTSIFTEFDTPQAKD